MTPCSRDEPAQHVGVERRRAAATTTAAAAQQRHPQLVGGGVEGRAASAAAPARCAGAVEAAGRRPGRPRPRCATATPLGRAGRAGGVHRRRPGCPGRPRRRAGGRLGGQRRSPSASTTGPPCDAAAVAARRWSVSSTRAPASASMQRASGPAGCARVQRQVRAAGLEHRRARRRPGRPSAPAAAPTTVSGPTPQRDQAVGQPVGPRVQLGVATARRRRDDQRDRVRRARRPGRSNSSGSVAGGTVAGGVVPARSAPACRSAVGRAASSVGDGARSGSAATAASSDATRCAASRSTVLGVEQVGVVRRRRPRRRRRRVLGELDA